MKNKTTDDDVNRRLSYLAQAMVGPEAGSDYTFLQLEYLEHCIRGLERRSGLSAPTYRAFVKTYDGPLPDLARQEHRLARRRAEAA